MSAEAKSSLWIEVSDLIEGTTVELKRLEKEAKGKSTGSSNSSSSNLSSNWDIDLGAIGDKNEGAKVEDGEEVNQAEDPTPAPALAPPAFIPIVEPIFVPSSDSDSADDLEFPEV